MFWRLSSIIVWTVVVPFLPEFLAVPTYSCTACKTKTTKTEQHGNGRNSFLSFLLGARTCLNTGDWGYPNLQHSDSARQSKHCVEAGRPPQTTTEPI